MLFNRYARNGGRRRALAPAWWACGLLIATAGGPAVTAAAGVAHAPLRPGGPGPRPSG